MRSSGDKWICSMLPYTQTAQQQSAAFLYITPQKITDSSGVETLTNQIHKTRDCSLNILFFLLRAFKISSLQQQPALWFCVYLLRNYRAFSSPWIGLNNTIIQINRSFIDWGGTWCLAKELENWRLPSNSKLHLALQAVLWLGISIAFLWFCFVFFLLFSSCWTKLLTNTYKSGLEFEINRYEPGRSPVQMYLYCSMHVPKRASARRI